tara:strand:- start:3359 stop:3976 length:618 start_codon:yes stop_codon:yes gene_type:complete
LASSLLTALLVQSGLDWRYFVWIQNSRAVGLLPLADRVGYVAPVLVSLGLAAVATVAPRRGAWSLTGASVAAALGGLAVSVALKSVTGRMSPPHHAFGAGLEGADNSAAFQFGFLNQPLIGGWPSSHATVAFAVLVALVLLTRRRTYVVIFGSPLALFIGLGVSFGYHWLSEFASGILIGSAVGYAVAQSLGGPDFRTGESPNET